jgi:WhiB family redox-sensing transcriptional regulator
MTMTIDLPFFADPEGDDGSWREQGHCHSGDSSCFFDGRRTKEAKAMCNMCPVADKCLAFALTNNLQDGVWGGYTFKERKLLK